jgi:hypothetical protein
MCLQSEMHHMHPIQMDGSRLLHCSRKKLRLRLDVDIGSLGTELDQIPNQTSIDIELQYQSCCLDADGIIRWHCKS